MDQRTGGIGQFRNCFSEITGNVLVQHTADGVVINPPWDARHSVPHIKGNDLISESSGYAIRLDPVMAWFKHPDVDATDNYWGSGDPAEIEARIYDGMDTWFTLV